jgi:hypothetical protein
MGVLARILAKVKLYISFSLRIRMRTLFRVLSCDLQVFLIPLKVNRRFGGTYLHLRGRISLERYQRESRWQANCLVRLIRLRRWMRYVPPKPRMTFNELHGLISHKITLFMSTAVRSSNPTFCRVIRQHVCYTVETSSLNIIRTSRSLA